MRRKMSKKVAAILLAVIMAIPQTGMPIIAAEAPADGDMAVESTVEVVSDELTTDVPEESVTES